MSSSGGEQALGGGWGGARGRPETWWEFDSLPRGVKRLYWDAPYNYTAAPAVRAFASGLDMRIAVARQRKAMERDVRREVLRLYGPYHPQARA